MAPKGGGGHGGGGHGGGRSGGGKAVGAAGGGGGGHSGAGALGVDRGLLLLLLLPMLGFLFEDMDTGEVAKWLMGRGKGALRQALDASTRREEPVGHCNADSG